MPKKNNEQRKNPRYDTDVEVFFHFPYNIKTRVDYQLTDKDFEKHLSPKYLGVSKNVSAEGLCFHSNKHLNKGDNLLIELVLPGDKKPVFMEAKVRWSEDTKDDSGFDTGVQLLSVNGQEVHETVYFDETYHVEWSAALEAILGKYRILSQKRSK